MTTTAEESFVVIFIVNDEPVPFASKPSQDARSIEKPPAVHLLDNGATAAVDLIEIHHSNTNNCFLPPHCLGCGNISWHCPMSRIPKKFPCLNELNFANTPAAKKRGQTHSLPVSGSTVTEMPKTATFCGELWVRLCTLDSVARLAVDDLDNQPQFG